VSTNAQEYPIPDAGSQRQARKLPRAVGSSCSRRCQKCVHICDECGLTSAVFAVAIGEQRCEASCVCPERVEIASNQFSRGEILPSGASRQASLVHEHRLMSVFLCASFESQKPLGSAPATGRPRRVTCTIRAKATAVCGALSKMSERPTWSQIMSSIFTTAVRPRGSNGDDVSMNSIVNLGHGCTCCRALGFRMVTGGDRWDACRVCRL